MPSRRTRTLAIASGGGHWIQLRAIAGNLDCDLSFVTTQVPAGNVEGDIHYVPDANKTQPLRVVALTLRIAYLLLRVNPQQVITTGAAPGCVAVLLARLLGKPVIFIDSIANADTISLSGRIACRAGVTTLTQWPHLAESRRVLYVGNVFGETP